MGDIATIAANTGYCYTQIRKNSEAGKKTPEIKEVGWEKFIEETERVSETYNAKGKIARGRNYRNPLLDTYA